MGNSAEENGAEEGDIPLRGASAPEEYHNENSDYAIALGRSGLTSGYAALDESTHTVGEHEITKTYVLRFQDPSFTVTNGIGESIKKKDLITITGESQALFGFADGTTYGAADFSRYYKTNIADRASLTAAGYVPEESSTAWYYLYLNSSDLGLDYAVLIEITPNGAVSATPFEISVSKTSAAAELETVSSPAAGVSFFLSDPQDDADLAKASPAATELDVQTDESGKAHITWYSEGWYRLAVADVTPQKTGNIDAEGYVTGGAYDNLAVGDYVLLHVVPAADTAAVRAALQAEMDE